jgi:hypothetical protein
MSFWNNFDTARYQQLKEARLGQQYNMGELLRKYAEINSHLTLEKALHNFQVKFKNILR